MSLPKDKISLLQEKLEKLTGKKVSLFEDHKQYDTAQLITLVDLIAQKKVSTLKALHFLQEIYDDNQFEEFSDLFEVFGKMKHGSNEMEASLERVGYKLTSSDIKEMNDDEIVDLLSGVFYSQGLFRLVGEEAMNALVTRITTDQTVRAAMLDQDTIETLKNNNNRKKDAERIITLFSEE